MFSGRNNRSGEEDGVTLDYRQDIRSSGRDMGGWVRSEGWTNRETDDWSRTLRGRQECGREIRLDNGSDLTLPC